MDPPDIDVIFDILEVPGLAVTIAVVEALPDPPNEFATNFTALAAGSHRLDILQYLRQHNWAWDEWACACAAESGDLPILQWAREN